VRIEEGRDSAAPAAGRSSRQRGACDGSDVGAVSTATATLAEIGRETDEAAHRGWKRIPGPPDGQGSTRANSSESTVSPASPSRVVVTAIRIMHTRGSTSESVARFGSHRTSMSCPGSTT
jgi:hypothetical protein